MTRRKLPPNPKTDRNPRGAGRRREFHRLGQYAIYMPPELCERLDVAAWRIEMSRSEVIRMLCELWLDRQLKQAPKAPKEAA